MCAYLFTDLNPNVNSKVSHRVHSEQKIFKYTQRKTTLENVLFITKTIFQLEFKLNKL